MPQTPANGTRSPGQEEQLGASPSGGTLAGGSSRSPVTWRPNVTTIDPVETPASFKVNIDELEDFERAYLIKGNETKARYKIGLPEEEEYRAKFAFMGKVGAQSKGNGKLVSWLGVAGSAVGDSVAPAWGLPDGRILRLFHTSQKRNARVPYPELPEVMPDTLSGLRVQRLPQRPLPPAPNERDVPKIPVTVELISPIPAKSLLEQTHPPPNYGEITVDPFTLMVSEFVEKPAGTDKEEEEKKEPFILEKSIFAPRAKLSDGHSFYTPRSITQRAFNIDWSRCNTPHFRQLIAREDDGGFVTADIELTEVRDALLESHQMLYSAYTYYCALDGHADGHVMGMGVYFEFLRDARLIVQDSEYCNTKVYEEIFRAANIEVKGNTIEQRELNQKNDDQALMRFEFLQIIVRIAINKYVRDKEAKYHKADVSDAVHALLNNDLLPNLPPEATRDPDLFRRKRLYTREVADLFTSYKPALTTIFEYYAAMEGEMMTMPGGLREAPSLTMFEFMTFLHDSQMLLEEHQTVADNPTGLTAMQMRLTLLWSKAFVSDELKRRQKHTTANYTDFLEMLGRICTFIDMPTKAMLKKQGVATVKEFYDSGGMTSAVSKRGSVLTEGANNLSGGKVRATTPSGKPKEDEPQPFYWKTEEESTEPLVNSLEMLINLILDRLDEGGDGKVCRADLIKRRKRTENEQEVMIALRGASILGPEDEDEPEHKAHRERRRSVIHHRDELTNIKES